MGEESSGLNALLVILGCAGGGAWGWRQVSMLARRRGWGKLLRYALSLVAGVITAFGAVFLLGSFVMPNTEGGAGVAGGLGVVLLTPFAWLHWRNRQAARASTAEGDEAPRFAAAPLHADPAQPPVQPPAPLTPKKPPRPAERSSAVPVARITLPHRFRITYRDKAISWVERDVRVDLISSNGSYTYLEGFCELRCDVRMFRTDRIRGELLDLETGEVLPLRRLLADVVERSAASFQPSESAGSSSHGNREWQQAAFFAGFSLSKRDELEGLAEAAGWQVRQTITRTVTYVVAGSMVGKNQISEAKRMGVAVVDENAFRALL